MTNYQFKNTKRKNLKEGQLGYVLLESLFYVSFFAVLSILVITAMLQMTGSFKDTAVYAELTQASSIMERISREIRSAENISIIGAGNLKLNTRDSTDNPKTVEFLLSGTNVGLLENDISSGNLNGPSVNVTALSFTQINTAKGKAVKVFLTLTGDKDKYTRSYDFYNSVVLRGSY